jgi:hypothetical protein
MNKIEQAYMRGVKRAQAAITNALPEVVSDMVSNPPEWANAKPTPGPLTSGHDNKLENYRLKNIDLAGDDDVSADERPYYDAYSKAMISPHESTRTKQLIKNLRPMIQYEEKKYGPTSPEDKLYIKRFGRGARAYDDARKTQTPIEAFKTLHGQGHAEDVLEDLRGSIDDGTMQAGNTNPVSANLKAAYARGVKRAFEQLDVDPEDMELSPEERRDEIRRQVRKDDMRAARDSVLTGSALGAGMGISKILRSTGGATKDKVLAALASVLAGAGVGALGSPIRIARARTRNRKELLGEV